MSNLFPNTVGKLVDGPVRALIGRVAGATPAAVPTNISDIIAMVSPYAPKTGWTDLGATTDAASYGRGMDSAAYEIQQEQQSVFSKITAVNRSFTIPLAEIQEQNMQMIEEGGAITAITSGVGKGAQQKAPFGGIVSLTQYRVAFIAMRDPGMAGLVTEPTGGITRGPFVAVVGYRATLAAADSNMDIARGSLSSRAVTYTLYPEPTITVTNENTGAFFFEAAPATLT